LLVLTRLLTGRKKEGKLEEKNGFNFEALQKANQPASQPAGEWVEKLVSEWVGEGVRGVDGRLFVSIRYASKVVGEGRMSLYHETAAILSTPATHGGSLKSRIFGNRGGAGARNHVHVGNGNGKKSDDASNAKTGLKSPPAQVYALALESCKWSGVLKEVIEGAELLGRERKVRFFSFLVYHGASFLGAIENGMLILRMSI
jgi:hypothetical protein